MLPFLEYYLKTGTEATRLHSCFILRLRLVCLVSIWSWTLYSLHPCTSPITCNSVVFIYPMGVVINVFARWTKAINQLSVWKQHYNLWCLFFVNIDIGELLTPIRRCSRMLRCCRCPMSNVNIGLILTLKLTLTLILT